MSQTTIKYGQADQIHFDTNDRLENYSDNLHSFPYLFKLSEQRLHVNAKSLLVK